MTRNALTTRLGRRDASDSLMTHDHEVPRRGYRRTQRYRRDYRRVQPWALTTGVKKSRIRQISGPKTKGRLNLYLQDRRELRAEGSGH